VDGAAFVHEGRAGEAITAQGFRSTFRNLPRETTPRQREAVKMALAQAPREKVQWPMRAAACLPNAPSTWPTGNLTHPSAGRAGGAPTPSAN